MLNPAKIKVLFVCYSPNGKSGALGIVVMENTLALELTSLIQPASVPSSFSNLSATYSMKIQYCRMYFEQQLLRYFL